MPQLPVLRTLRGTAAPLLASLLLAACASLDDTPPATSITPMPGLGASRFPVTAHDDQARAWFGQGLQLAYAFEHAEAARVFRAALARDPTCAMCAWGVAYALGPNINDPDRSRARDIRRHIARAQQAAGGATPMERALIDALAVRWGSADDRAQQTYTALGTAMCSTRPADRKLDAQEYAYAAAMTDVLRQYPDDPDVVTLQADAVMSTLPWDWWDAKTGRPNGSVGEVIVRLADTVRRHPQHTGALHFYVHIAEHSPDPRQAEAAADALGPAAPDAPHLVHMGSHIYKNIGRFADGTRANQQALDVQQRFDAVLQAQGVAARGRWDAHHTHFLWYAALMEGRTSLALQTARAFAQRHGSQGDGLGDYARLLPLATLVRHQRWADVLAEPPSTGGLGLLEGFDAYARGMAHAHGGRLADAQAALAAVQRQRDQPTLQRARIFGDDVPARLLTLAHATLAGTIARREGRHDAAIAALRQAADIDDDLGTDPPMVGGGARLALAGALLDAGRVDEAAKEIAEALRVNGPSAWGHVGLALVADKRGDRAETGRQREMARAAFGAGEGMEMLRL